MGQAIIPPAKRGELRGEIGGNFHSPRGRPARPWPGWGITEPSNRLLSMFCVHVELEARDDG